jgi:hypothetical protein
MVFLGVHFACVCVGPQHIFDLFILRTQSFRSFKNEIYLHFLHVFFVISLLPPPPPLTSPLRVLYIEVYLYQITIFGSRSIQYLWTQTFQGWLAGFPRSRTNTTIENHRKPQKTHSKDVWQVFRVLEPTQP